MTISDLERWRDDNGLPDTWYLEVHWMGLGGVMTLADCSARARVAWRDGDPVRIVHVSMAGSEANWVMLYPEVRPEQQCPNCGANCAAQVGSFLGEGITCSEWLGIAIVVAMAIWIGSENGAIYGWLILVFFSLTVISKFFRQKRDIWRCPNCHLIRLRKK